MEKTLFTTAKRSVFSRVFVFAMIIAVIVPTVSLQKPIIVSAEENETSAPAESSQSSPAESAPSDTSTDSTPAESTAEATPAETTSAPTPTDSTTTTPASTDAIITEASDSSDAQTNNQSDTTGGGSATVVSSYSITMQPAEVNGHNVHVRGTAGGAYVGALANQRVSINWGDGETADATTYSFANAGSPIFHTMNGTWSSTHTYTAAGTFTVTVYVYNNQDTTGTQRSATQSQSVVVTNDPDPRLFSYSINMQPAQVTGMEVRLQGTAGGAPFVGALEDQKVHINWGDSSSAEDAHDTSFERVSSPVFGQMNGPWSSTHTYTTPGTYTVTVYVYNQDPNGVQRSDAVTQQVTVGTVLGGPGSIKVCFAIADQNGVVATNRTNLPAAALRVNVTDTASNNQVGTAVAYASAWSTNETIGGVRVNCLPAITNLPITASGYRYSQEIMNNYVSTYWTAPKYNDQFDTPITGINSFFSFSGELFDGDGSNDDQRNMNADGEIILTADQPARVLVVKNTYMDPIVTHCANGTMTADEFWNAHFTFVPGSNTQYLLEMTIPGRTTLSPSVLPANATQATFEFINRTNCNVPISFASYKVFDDVNTRIDTQVRIDAESANVQPNSTANLTVDLATCKTQVDGWYGTSAPLNFSNPNRSAYLYPNVPFQLYPAALTASDYCDNGGPGPGGNNPPVLTILGANPFTLIVGTPFNDPGVTATDDHDTPEYLAAHTASTTNLNINQVGSYTKVYTVTDSNGATDTETRVINVVNAPSACSVPTTLGDSTAETIGQTGQSSLQAILTAANLSLNAANDQKNYQQWGANSNLITAEAEFLNGYTTATALTFGYYLDGDMSTFSPLFSTVGTNPNYPNKQVFNPGQRISFAIPRNHTYGFAINVVNVDGTHVVTSQNSLNANNNDQMIAYDAATESYVLAFEDSSLINPNTDYNDMVVRFTITDCDGNGGGGNQAPTITLLGNNPMSITVGTQFVDPGATAWDPEEHDITNRIATTSTVDINTVGSYTVTYTVQDSQGLSDTEIRTVNVTTDGGGGGNQAPVITLLGDNPMRIERGDTFTEPGYTAFDPEERDITSRVVVSGSVDTGTVGTYTLTYTVSDTQGLTDTETRTVEVFRRSGGGGGGGGRRGGSSGGRAPEGQVLGAETGPCVYLNDYLRRDWNNNPSEVLKLQYFLKFSQGFGNLETNGVFDDATFAAVSTFQERYFSDILEPWGHTSSTGFVYILTKKKVNEIVCNSEFPLTPMQADEIREFRAYINGLRASGVTVSVPSYLTDDSAAVDMSDSSYRTSDDSEMSFNSTTSTSSPLISLSNDVKNGLNMDNLRGIASSIFSIPKDRGILLQSLYFFLIAIIAVYLFTEIIVGSRDMSGMTKYQIWSRKAISYTIGLILAIIAAIWYQIFSIVLPLIILTIISAIFFAWAVTRKATDTSVIELPPTKKTS